jgi:anti-sigma B factor antagonist
MVAVEQRGGGAHEAGLRIETREGPDGWTLVVLEGELDLGEAEEATRALAAAVDAAHGGLVVDLTALDFLGSTGVRVLIDATANALGRGLGFRTIPGDGPAWRIIDMLGLSERLGVEARPEA